MFGDVKVVCMGGSANRMALVAKRLQSTLDIDIPVRVVCALCVSLSESLLHALYTNSCFLYV